MKNQSSENKVLYNSELNGKSSKNDDDDTETRPGFFRKAIPIMPKPLAIICCLLNIVFPGLGTLVASFSVFCCATHSYDTNLKSFFINILAFALQLCSAIIIFGWIWSIKYGILFVHLSDKTADASIEPDLPLYVRRHSSMEATAIYHPKPKLSGVALAKVKEEEA